MYDSSNGPRRGRIPRPVVSQPTSMPTAPPMTPSPMGNPVDPRGNMLPTPAGAAPTGFPPPPVNPNGGVPLSSPLVATPDSAISTPVNRDGANAGEIGMPWNLRFGNRNKNPYGEM